jgi:GTP cyclohydrolase I
MEKGVRSEIEVMVRRFLSLIGEDVSRDGLKATPHRVSKFWDNFLTYNKELRVVREDEYENKEKKDEWYVTIFKNRERYDQIILRKCKFVSFCEHHLLPFFGVCYTSYIPNNLIIGLNKIDRVVDFYSHRFQLQERLTKQICEFLNNSLKPKGVMVVIKARHLCAEVNKNNGVFTTSAVSGVFRNYNTKMEALKLIDKG